MLAKIKNYFLTGVLVSAPVFITFWIVFSLVKFFDQLITPLIPYYINPNYYLPRDVPGLGLIILVTLLVFIGFITASFFGSFILKKTESLISKIPLIKIFYKTIKQIIETIFKNNSQAFREVVLLEYPRKGLWVFPEVPMNEAETKDAEVAVSPAWTQEDQGVVQKELN